MTIDTSRPMEIEMSPIRILLLVLVCAVLAMGSIAMAVDSEPGSFREFAGYFIGAPLLGGFALLGLWLLITTRGPVVTISPQGFRDTRIAPEMIPWTGVRLIYHVEDQYGAKCMVLNVDAATEEQLTLTRIARAFRRKTDSPDVHGLGVAPGGLKIDYQTLYKTTVAYAEAAWARNTQQAQA